MILVIGVYSAVLTLIAAIYLVIHYRYVIWSGYIRATFIGEDGRVYNRTFKVKSDREFDIAVGGVPHTYTLQKDRVYRYGKFRLPQVFYHVGKTPPLDIQKMRGDSDIASKQYAEMKSGVVIRSLLSVFKPKTLSAPMMMLLTLAIIGAGLLVLGWFIDKRISEVLAVHGVTG